MLLYGPHHHLPDLVTQGQAHYFANISIFIQIPRELRRDLFIYFGIYGISYFKKCLQDLGQGRF